MNVEFHRSVALVAAEEALAAARADYAAEVAWAVEVYGEDDLGAPEEYYGYYAVPLLEDALSALLPAVCAALPAAECEGCEDVFAKWFS